MFNSDKRFIRLAGIEEESIVDGPGLRFVLFTQGCLHNCKGCHNPATHSLSGGKLWNIEEIINQYSQNPLLSGMTFSGGEPFLQADILCDIALEVHKLGGDIVTYTGFTYEQLLIKAKNNEPAIVKLLDLTDILVDGPYIEKLRDLELLFRGSSNQRILDKNMRKKFAA